MKKYFVLLFLFCTATIAYCQQEVDKNHLKKYKKAIEKFNKSSDSTTADFYYKRGGIRQDNFDFSGAITDYNRSISMDPKNPKAYYNRGLAKMDIKLLNEAILDFTKAIEIDPTKDFAYNNRGICKYMQDKHEEAITDYSLAIQINPRLAEAYNNRGISKIKMGIMAEGCEDLHKAYALGDKKSLKAIEKYCTPK